MQSPFTSLKRYLPKSLFGRALLILVLPILLLQGVVAVGHGDGDVADEARHALVVVVPEVLRLVGELVVVAVAAGAEEGDGDPVPGVHVVVAPAIALLGVTGRVVGEVELERLLLCLVGGIDDVAQLGGDKKDESALETVSRIKFSVKVDSTIR